MIQFDEFEERYTEERRGSLVGKSWGISISVVLGCLLLLVMRNRLTPNVSIGGLKDVVMLAGFLAGGWALYWWATTEPCPSCDSRINVNDKICPKCRKSVVVLCPGCPQRLPQRLRVPTDKGNLSLHCPTCRHQWEWAPSDGQPTPQQQTGKRYDLQTKIIDCPKCSQHLRVPADKGTLEVRCLCGHQWEWAPSDGQPAPSNDRRKSTTPQTKVIGCPKCGQHLRVPADKGTLEARCPKCKSGWTWTPEPTAEPTMPVRCPECGGASLTLFLHAHPPFVGCLRCSHTWDCPSPPPP